MTLVGSEGLLIRTIWRSLFSGYYFGKLLALGHLVPVNLFQYSVILIRFFIWLGTIPKGN